MIQKKLPITIFTAAIMFFSSQTKAQLTINSATFTIQPGATVTVQGDVTSNTDIQGTGTILLNGTANQNVDMGGFTIPNLQVDNAANVTLKSAAQISTNLAFTAGDIILGNNSLEIGSAATVTGASNTQFVVTNGTGRLVKAALGTTAFTYPVGNSTTTYNPVTISNSGTADSIGVLALGDAFTTGATGTAITKEVVDASWDINEAVAGGSNLSLTTSWYATDELTGFNRTKSGISYYITTPSTNVGWDLTNAQVAAATGSNPYSYTRTGITTLGTFAVGNRPVLTPLLVTPKVFLQGSYNTTTGLMAAGLAAVLPTTEPYSAITGFTQSGSGGGETATSAVLTSTTVPNNEIVDWVFVQLHRLSDSVVISTRSALLQRNGSIVETDGVSPLNFAGNLAGSYYISVRHRNHLGVRTKNILVLAKTTATSFDFTNNIAQVYSTVTPPNAPLATLATNIYGMYGGNANSDGFTRKTGAASVNDYSLLLSSVSSVAAPGPTGVYLNADFNMDGNVRKTGPPTGNDYSKLLSILTGVSASTNIITQPTF